MTGQVILSCIVPGGNLIQELAHLSSIHALFKVNYAILKQIKCHFELTYRGFERLTRWRNERAKK